jgi:hypothetical protein
MQPAATPTPQIVTAKTPGPSLLVEGVVLALGAMVLRRR